MNPEAHNKKYPKPLFILYFALVIFLAIYLVKCGIQLADTMPKAINESNRDTTTVVDEYLDLFTDTARKELTLINTRKSAYRGDISVLNYSGQANVLIYKLEIRPGQVIDSVHISMGNADRSADVTYTGLPSYAFCKTMYAVEPGQNSGNGYLTIQGAPIRSLSGNDSTANYFSSVKQLAVKYEEEGIVMFHVISREGIAVPKIPMDISIIKRMGRLYLLLMTPINDKKINEGTLSSIIK